MNLTEEDFKYSKAENIPNNAFEYILISNQDEKYIERKEFTFTGKIDNNDSVNDAKSYKCLTIKSLHDKLGKLLEEGYDSEMKILLSKENALCDDTITIMYDPNGVIILSSISIENILSSIDNYEHRKQYESCIKIL